MASEQPHLLLHTYYRSSCTARVRTALHLKNLTYTPTYLNLLTKDQQSTSYSAINPSASVPTLTITPPSGPKIVIRQSLAILEFLDEYFPRTTPLLPPLSNPIQRAKVRELVNIIVSDIQPPTNLRNSQRVRDLAAGNEEVVSKWTKEITMAGLKAFDKLAEEYSDGGRYCVGNEITMADVVLAPAVEGALRAGVDVEAFGTVWRIYQEVKNIEAFRKGSWKAQEDTPEELREG
jgi:maleylacetoacetate isomerase